MDVLIPSYNHCKLLFIKINPKCYLSKNNCTFCGRFEPTYYNDDLFYRPWCYMQRRYHLCSDAYKNILQF